MKSTSAPSSVLNMVGIRLLPTIRPNSNTRPLFTGSVQISTSSLSATSSMLIHAPYYPLPRPLISFSAIRGARKSISSIIRLSRSQQKLAQQARQHPRVAWSQRNIRRIRYLYPNKFMHRQLFSWKGTNEEAETLMRRTLGLWWGWRYVKVKMTDKIEDEEGKQIWSPSMDVLLENKVMVRKGKTP